ncbi:MAG: hypothetical protein ACOH2I_00605 [Pseudomonas sp.]
MTATHITGFPVDAMNIAIARAEAVLALLAVQFDDREAEQMAAEVNSDALGVVRAELATLRELIQQGQQSTSASA